MKKLYTLILSIVSINCIAQLSISTAGTPVVIDFENTISGVNNGNFDGSGLQTSPGTGELDSDAWAIEGLSDGDITYGDNSTTGDYAKGISTGGEFSGGLYAWDISGDTAIGFQPTGGDWTPGNLTLKVEKNTGGALGSVALFFSLFINYDSG